MARKLEVIKRQSAQIESLERPVKSQREMLVEHMVTLPQFSKIADFHGLRLDGPKQLQKVMELASLVDDALEGKTHLPPRPKNISKTPSGFSHFITGPAKSISGVS